MANFEYLAGVRRTREIVDAADWVFDAADVTWSPVTGDWAIVADAVSVSYPMPPLPEPVDPEWA